MPPAQQSAAVSLVISIGVAAAAILLGLRQWHERRLREPDLSAADASHFARQDLRRALGVVVMLLLAAGLSAGARVEWRLAGRANPLFIQLWLGVFLLILILLVLAVLDWLSTRLYARRHVRAMARERLEILRDEYKLREQLERGEGHSGTGNGAP
jgi:hypothetical protein